MDILIAIKQVEDPIIPPSHMVLDGTGKRATSSSSAPQVMNGYDANALEEAIRLKEKHGGKLTAISLGDESARKTLKRAIAMGADNAVLLSDRAWDALDSYGIARVLAAAIRKIGPIDLVLCGRQESDSDGGQVLYWLAQMLELPVVSPIIKIEDSRTDSLVVNQPIDQEFQRLKVELPALLGISSETNEPRLPTPKGTVAATRAMIPVWKAASLDAGELTPKITVKKLDIQVRTSKVEIIEGATETASGRALADKLHELGLV